MMRVAAFALGLAGMVALAGCGRYGPPVRTVPTPGPPAAAPAASAPDAGGTGGAASPTVPAAPTDEERQP